MQNHHWWMELVMLKQVGFFSAEMKFAGYDGVVVRGKADHPVYLLIRGGEVEIRDASHLWGKTTGEVEELLKEELQDSKIEIAQCDPLRRKMVRVAAIMSMANRACGRTGMGAVMGSKNLKANVVPGSSKKIPVAHPGQLAERLYLASADWLSVYTTYPVEYPMHASGTNYDTINREGIH